MNKSLYNLLMFLYFNSLVKTFLFCDDCEDHLMMYAEDLKSLTPYLERISELLGKKDNKIVIGADSEWKYLDTDVSFGIFETKGEEDEDLGALRVEIDLLQGKAFDKLLRNLYLLEAEGNK